MDETIQESTNVEADKEQVSIDTHANDNTETNDLSDEPPIKRAHFTPSKKEDNACELPKPLVEYVNDSMKSFVKDKDLKETILDENLVPKNISKIKKLDLHLKDLLKNQNKKLSLQSEDHLINVH